MGGGRAASCLNIFSLRLRFQHNCPRRKLQAGKKGQTREEEKEKRKKGTVALIGTYKIQGIWNCFWTK
jgi:hypothetical protein